MGIFPPANFSGKHYAFTISKIKNQWMRFITKFNI
jgi:hypothetical protein